MIATAYTDKDKTAAHGGHRSRIKENFINGNADSFRDHQLLELLLFYSIPRRDTNVIAHSLLNEFGSLDGVFRASYNSLLKVKGVGEETATLIKIICTIEDRKCFLEAKNDKTPMSSEDMCKYLCAFYRSKKNETIVLLSCDNKRRIKKLDIVGEGSVNSTDINSRKIVEAAINSSASYVVLAHNHPNGAAKPSDADIDSTRSLIVMLRRLDIGVYDHIIVGADGDSFSMREDSQFSKMFM